MYTFDILSWLFDSFPYPAYNKFRDTVFYVTTVDDDLGYTLLQRSKARWEENSAVLKETTPYLHGMCTQTLTGTQMNCVFWIITLFCLLGCLEFFQVQLTKDWRKDSKHHGEKKSLLQTRMASGVLPGTQGRVCQANAKLVSPTQMPHSPRYLS